MPPPVGSARDILGATLPPTPSGRGGNGAPPVPSGDRSAAGALPNRDIAASRPTDSLKAPSVRVFAGQGQIC